jgi:hypothetical protein
MMRPTGRTSIALGAALSAVALSFWGLGANLDHRHAPAPAPVDGGVHADSSSWSLGHVGPGVGAGGGIKPLSSSWS